MAWAFHPPMMLSTARMSSARVVLKTAAARKSSGKPMSLPNARLAPIRDWSSGPGEYGLAKTSVEAADGSVLKAKA
eukprot:5698933-Prymnesium_polylepis.3